MQIVWQKLCTLPSADMGLLCTSFLISQGREFVNHVNCAISSETSICCDGLFVSWFVFSSSGSLELRCGDNQYSCITLPISVFKVKFW